MCQKDILTTYFAVQTKQKKDGFYRWHSWNWNFAQRYDRGKWRVQFISVYCLFFDLCPNNISGNGRNLISFLYGRLRGAVFKWYLNGIKTLAVMGGEKKRGQVEQQTPLRETTNAALTRGAGDKKHITITYRQGCRYVIAGLKLVKIIDNWTTIFSLLSFYWTTIIDN